MEFQKPAQAKKALEAENEAEIEGRNLSIAFSGGKPMMQGGGDRSFGGRPSGGGGTSTTLFVGNLKFDSNEDGLMNIF